MFFLGNLEEIFAKMIFWKHRVSYQSLGFRFARSRWRLSEEWRIFS